MTEHSACGQRFVPALLVFQVGVLPLSGYTWSLPLSVLNRVDLARVGFALTTREQFIVNALRTRFADVCARGTTIRPASFASSQDDATALLRRLASRHVDSQVIVTTRWSTADVDCLTALKRLAVDEQLRLRTASPPETDLVQQLKDAAGNPNARFKLLTDYYSCPLNIALNSEEQVREYLLERVMVHLRSRIEKTSINSVNAGDLFLMLNLIAVHALSSADLRFLDALNYHFEVLPADYLPKSEHSWLMVSFYVLYATALACAATRFEKCE